MPGEFRKASWWRLIFGLGLKGKIRVCLIDKRRVALQRERERERQRLRIFLSK